MTPGWGERLLAVGLPADGRALAEVAWLAARLTDDPGWDPDADTEEVAPPRQAQESAAPAVSPGL